MNWNMLKGIGGEPELIRILGALGVLASIVAPLGFTIWDMIRGSVFDVTAFCLAYSAGIAGVIAGTGGAAAIKDRSVATARLTTAKAHNEAATSPVGNAAQARADTMQVRADAAQVKADGALAPAPDSSRITPDDPD